MQHDLYTWQVLGGEFVKDELTNSSEFIDKTITNWLKEVSPEQRGEFFDTLFDILNTTEAKTLSELSKINWKLQKDYWKVTNISMMKVKNFYQRHYLFYFNLQEEVLL